MSKAILNDYMCPECGHAEDDVFCEFDVVVVCPECGKDMQIKVQGACVKMHGNKGLLKFVREIR